MIYDKLLIENLERELVVPVRKYALITTEGQIVITDPTSDTNDKKTTSEEES